MSVQETFHLGMCCFYRLLEIELNKFFFFFFPKKKANRSWWLFPSLPIFWPDLFVASYLISSKSSFIIYTASYFNLPSSVIPAGFLIIFNVFLTFYSFCGLNLFSIFNFRYSDTKRCRTAVFLFTWWLGDTMECLKTILALFAVIWHFKLISCSLGLLGLIWQCCFLCVFLSLQLHITVRIKWALASKTVFYYHFYISNLPNRLHQFSLLSRDFTVPK